LAIDAPKATSKPIAPKVVGSVELMVNAAVDAIKRLDGPAKGIILNPKELKKTSVSSISVVILVHIFVNSKAKGTL